MQLESVIQCALNCRAVFLCFQILQISTPALRSLPPSTGNPPNALPPTLQYLIISSLVWSAARASHGVSPVCPSFLSILLSIIHFKPLSDLHLLNKSTFKRFFLNMKCCLCTLSLILQGEPSLRVTFSGPRRSWRATRRMRTTPTLEKSDAPPPPSRTARDPNAGERETELKGKVFQTGKKMAG